MDVTCKNAGDCDFEACLSECSFVSIDGEFTGLRGNRAFRLNMFDTAEERFRKQNFGSSGMLVVQVGISFFKHIALNEFKVDSFNFYISPRTPHYCVRDRCFTFQTSSLDLLFKANFSFDKCFRDGLTYISEKELEECRASIQQRAANRVACNNRNIGNSDSTSVSTTTKNHWWSEFENNICNKLDEALLNGTDRMELSDFTEEERSVLLRVVERKYKDKFVLLSNSVSLMKSEEDWLDLQLADVENCIGFTKFFRQLSKSRKLLVGHNVYLDVINLYRQFIGQLPETYEDAKSRLHDVFPNIIDTKLLASMDPLKDCISSTALPELYKAIQRSPFKCPTIHNSRFGENADDRLHQAGYDSFITGVVFISLAEKLCHLKEEKPGTLPHESVSLQSYRNKIFMFQSWDYNFISLDRLDAIPVRKGVFLVNFPQTFKTNDLLEIFKPFGRVQIGWIDDTSAYVGLNDSDQAQFVLKKLCSDNAVLPAGVSVIPWNSFQKRKSANRNEDEGDKKRIKQSDSMYDVPNQW